MNQTFAHKLAHIAVSKAKELHLTHNEEELLKKYLGVPGAKPANHDRKGHVCIHNTEQHILNTLHPIIRDKFPNEYATI